MMPATEADLAMEFLWYAWKVPEAESAEPGLALQGMVEILH